MPTTRLIYSEAEIKVLLAKAISADRPDLQGNARVIFNVSGGLSGNDPRERHEPYVESVTVEIS